MAQKVAKPEDKIAYYRKAADEALRNAGSATDPDVRKAYLNIMNTWIYLADELEREMSFWGSDGPPSDEDDMFILPPANSDRHRSRDR
jgi:hypothetical protein